MKIKTEDIISKIDQIKILGGNQEMGNDIIGVTINLSRDCKKTFADCNVFCQPTTNNPF